jgi:hypothetical protein
LPPRLAPVPASQAIAELGKRRIARNCIPTADEVFDCRSERLGDLLCAVMEACALRHARRRVDVVLQWTNAVLASYGVPPLGTRAPGRPAAQQSQSHRVWAGLWRQVAATGGTPLCVLCHAAGTSTLSLSDVYRVPDSDIKRSSNVRYALASLSGVGAPVVLDAHQLFGGPPDDDVMLLQLDLVYFRTRNCR